MKFVSSKLLALVEADSRLSKDIASEAGFSAGALSQWAKGVRTPGANELAALAKVFKVPMDYFFDEAEVGRGDPIKQKADQLQQRLENVQTILRTALKVSEAPLSSSSTAKVDRVLQELVKFSKAQAQAPNESGQN